MRNQANKHDTRGDVYSLGVIFWEISADGAIPFADAGILAFAYILQGVRETPVKDTPAEYVTLYSECWDDDPEKRPKLSKILTRLDIPMQVENDNVKDEIAATASSQTVKSEVYVDSGFAELTGMLLKNSMLCIVLVTYIYICLYSGTITGEKTEDDISKYLMQNTTLTELKISGMIYYLL